MSYQVAFDITKTSFSHWSPLIFILAVIIIVYLANHWLARSRDKKSKRRLFLGSIFVTLFLSSVPALIFVFTFHDYLTLKSDAMESHCNIVEGIVSNFRQGPFFPVEPDTVGSDQGETFTVNNVEFKYPTEGNRMVNGFHKAGVIKPGMQVRIFYCEDVNKQITRLEISQ